MSASEIVKYAKPTCIVIGVCTRNRPKMLWQCLASVVDLDIPDGSTVSVVVVDNADEPLARGIVADLNGEHALLAIRYVHETRQGISYARNAVLSAAGQFGADWIVMIDDDQIVPHDWLVSMAIAQQETNADVIKSAVKYLYPSPLPMWAFPKPPRLKWRHDADMATTNGVMFSAHLISREGLNLRFDEEFALSSGEDRAFFRTAYLRGAHIVHTPLAIAMEYTPSTKLQFAYQIQREYWQEITNSRQDIRFYGLVRALAAKIPKILQCLLSGVFYGAVSAPAFLFSRQGGRRHLLRGCRKLAKAAGIAAGLIGLARPEPYRVIHGN